jgi:hypothetical protein
MNDQDTALFDPRIADWLEGDPNEAPDQALQVVLAAFPSVRQRHGSRLPWRFHTMPTSFKLALGAMVVIAVVLGGAYVLGPPSGGVGGPNPTPLPTVNPSPSASGSGSFTNTSTWTLFTSSRYGFTAAYPPTFGTSPSSEFWVIPESESTSPTEWDLFHLGSGDPTWSGASVPLPAGQTETAWLTAYREGQNDPTRPAVCNPSPAALSTVVIDGHTGSLRLGCGEMEALVLVGDRVYSFAGWSGPAPTTPGMPAGQRELFEAFLSTIRLDPASAVEAPAASPSLPASPGPS